jgi:cysteine desulfurase
LDSNLIREDTIGVSLIGVHNEIGTIQKLNEIGDICRDRGVFFHTDCAQAIGKIPIDVKEMKIDLLSISGHKVKYHSFLIFFGNFDFMLFYN